MMNTVRICASCENFQA